MNFLKHPGGISNRNPITIFDEKFKEISNYLLQASLEVIIWKDEEVLCHFETDFETKSLKEVFCSSKLFVKINK